MERVMQIGRFESISFVESRKIHGEKIYGKFNEHNEII